jgi:hypothetical protein
MNGDNTTKQAKDILTMGCMPAVPPARREWAETIVNFSIGDAQIKWPPKDWREMNSDKKLHAWEFVSTQLEFRSFCSFVPGNARKLYLSNRSIRSMIGNDPVRRNSSWVER